MITAVKKYLVERLTAAGLTGAIYSDASEAQRHKRPPWASVLSPAERQGLDLTRVDEVISRSFDDDAKTWTVITRIFEARLHLDVIIAGPDLAGAEALHLAWLAGLHRSIWLDPAHPVGWYLDPAEAVSSLNQAVGITVSGSVVSDSLASIKHETQISTRLVVTGGVLSETTVPALPGVEIATTLADPGGS